MESATARQRPCFRCIAAIGALASLAQPSALSAGGSVRWSIETGWLTARTADVPILKPSAGPSADVTINGKPFIGGRKVAAKVRRTRGGGFEVTHAIATGTLVDRYEPFARLGENAWLRTLVYTNRSKTSQDLHGATMRIAPVPMKGGASWNPRDFWIGQAAADRAVCVSYRGSTDHHSLAVDGKHRVFHHVSACWRLAPGQQATIGSQGIWLGRPGSEAFRQEARRWFEAIDLHVPQDTPDWLYDTILYEVCAGGHIDTRFSDVGGFDRLGRQVDYLADLGIDAVWLQAPHQHKTPPNPVKGGWNHYDPRDFTNIDAILGGPEALERLTDGFRARGIRVFGEVVPHGGKSVQARSLEQWWTYKRDGKPQRNWGGCGMDYSSPQWQAVMRDAAARLSRDFGMVGVRVDVADGSGPNWRSPRTHHASYSTLGGAIEMLRAIRDGMAEHHPSPVLIPESWNTVEFFALSPVYGHAGWFLFGRDIPRLVDRPVEMVDKLREFFETQRGSHPAGARILRTLNNHDTVAHFGRTHYRFGVGLAGALYGVCLMVPGIPMMYQEEEVGCYLIRRRMNWARRRVPEFAGGDVDYSAVTLAREVFACLRRCGDGSAIGLANLSGKRIAGTVNLTKRVKIPDGTRVYDAVSGRSSTVEGNGCSFPWTLGPYETSLIRVGKRPVGKVPAERYRGEDRAVSCESSRFVIQPDPRGVRIAGGRLVAELHAGPGPWTRDNQGHDVIRLTSPYGSIRVAPRGDAFDVELRLSKSGPKHTPEIVVSNADRWRVSGRTALLSDRVMRRHFPFPSKVNYVWDRTMAWGAGPRGGPYYHVAPTGRLWQSIIEPLHPDKPAWMVQDGQGTSLVFSRIESAAGNLVLTDRSDEAWPGPYGLAFRFHAVDPDLSPRLAAVGWEPWTMSSYPRAKPDPMAVRFTVSCCDAKHAAAMLDAPRLPVRRRGATVARSGGRFRESNRAVWLVDPGTLTWSNLTPPTKGRHRIRLELRHSEVSPQGTDLQDAYEIRIDGEAVPLQWLKHNTWQTGNAYFGHAATPPIDLSKQARKIQIRTSKTWCAVRGNFHVMGARAD